MSNITLSQSEAERLELLIEEASEVIKAATKILRHGYESYDPTKAAVMRSTNRYDLIEELGDLMAVVTRMDDAGDIRLPAVMDRRDYKLERGGKYLHHQEVVNPGVKIMEQARREAEAANPMINLEVSLSPELAERLGKYDPKTLRTIQALGSSRCTRPPIGWQCARGAGHHGPCAAYRDGDGYQPTDELPPGSNPQPPKSR